MDALTTGPLTPDQRIRKNQLEAKIRTHLASFWEAGAALMEIHDSKLYREDYPTFVQYCDERWGFKDRHARRLIFASQVVEQIGPMGPLVTERAIREMSALEPDQYQPTWDQVVKEANGGRISAALINRVVKAATAVTIEIVQTKGNVTLGEDSVPLIEGSITERMAEDRARQVEHIAVSSQYERLETFEVTAFDAPYRITKLLESLDKSEMVKISVYVRKLDARQPGA